MTITSFLLQVLESINPQIYLPLGLLVFWLLYRLGWLRTLTRCIDGAIGGRLSTSLTSLRAKRAEWNGDWSSAGALHEQTENNHRAIECFELARDYERCAEICLALGRRDYAAEWLELAGEPRRAADLFREASMFARAAEAYLRAGAHLRAAAALVPSGNYLGAAQLYFEHGCFQDAGDAFEKAGQLEKAAECFEQDMTETGDLRSLTLTTAERELASRTSLRASQCFERAGSLEEAQRVLTMGQHYGAAAATAARLQDFREAARLYRESGDLDKAHDALLRAGDRRGAFRLKAELHLDSGNAMAGAECLLEAGDPVRAAEVFQTLGEITRAAQCYVKAGELVRTAALLYQSHRYHEAAMLFRQAGLFYHAAHAASSAGDQRLMVDCLRRVRPGDPNFGYASGLLAKLVAPQSA